MSVKTKNQSGNFNKLDRDYRDATSEELERCLLPRARDVIFEFGIYSGIFLLLAGLLAFFPMRKGEKELLPLFVVIFALCVIGVLITTIRYLLLKSSLQNSDYMSRYSIRRVSFVESSVKKNKILSLRLAKLNSVNELETFDCERRLLRKTIKEDAISSGSDDLWCIVLKGSKVVYVGRYIDYEPLSTTEIFKMIKENKGKS